MKVRNMALACVAALVTTAAALADAQLNAAVAPNARSVEVGSPATFFATILNSGDTPATNCRVEADPENSLGTDMDYRRTDATNQAIGDSNSPFSIPAGGSQTLVLTVRPNDTTGGAPYGFEYICDEARHSGIPSTGSVYIRSFTEGSDASDMIMTLQTLSGDGIIRIDENGRRGVAAGAMVNIGGEAGNLNLRVGFPGYFFQPAGPVDNFYRDLLICQTDSSGICMQAPSRRLEFFSFPSDQIITFNVYFDDHVGNTVPLMPEFLRLVVDAFEQPLPNLPGVYGLAGATSVAVAAPNGPAIDDSQPTSGQWYGYFGDPSDIFLNRFQVTLTPSGDFVFRTALQAHRFPDAEFYRNTTLFGSVETTRDGSQIRPTGLLDHIDGSSLPTQASIDGLVLNFSTPMSSRPTALSGERVRGYYRRPVPTSSLRLVYMNFNQFGTFGGDNTFAVRSLIDSPFSVDSTVALQPDEETFSGGAFRASVGESIDTCSISASLVVREGEPGEPAPQTFDASLTLSECSGDANFELEGQYDGWAIAEDWYEHEALPNGSALCGVLIFVERSDGLSLPLWFYNNITYYRQEGTLIYNCNSTY